MIGVNINIFLGIDGVVFYLIFHILLLFIGYFVAHHHIEYYLGNVHTCKIVSSHRQEKSEFIETIYFHEKLSFWSKQTPATIS